MRLNSGGGRSSTFYSSYAEWLNRSSFFSLAPIACRQFVCVFKSVYVINKTNRRKGLKAKETTRYGPILVKVNDKTM